MSAPRTVTISLPPEVAREVDRIARAEGRTRSELLREAFRQYVSRLERWERIFVAAKSVPRRSRLTESAVARLVTQRRRSRRR
jgi:CopG family transcriptional regulator/antitoxin EndoAI